MKRHTIFLLTAVALAVLALALGNRVMLGVVMLVFAAVWGLGAAFPQMRFFVDFVWRARTEKKQVALTFDDGPDPGSTPQLLALLRERKIAAAFFGIGAEVVAHPELSAQIVREGHLLENHSYTHSHCTNFYSPARLRTELGRTQAAILMRTGVAPRFFRPPCGLSNNFTQGAIRSVDLTAVAWSIRSLDTMIGAPEKIVARIVRRLHPGAIILLHDGGIPGDKLIATMRLLLDELQKRGYEVTRLDRMI